MIIFEGEIDWSESLWIQESYKRGSDPVEGSGKAFSKI